MGYRSVVAIKIYGSKAVMVEFKKGYTELFLALEEEPLGMVNRMIGSYEFNGFNIPDEDEYDCGEYTLYAEDVKWYDEYPSVIFFDSIQKLAVRLGGNVELVRVGEDLTDCDYQCEGDDVEYRLAVTRLITGY
jgi:hypothetical protein